MNSAHMLNAISSSASPGPGGGKNMLVISRYHWPTADPDRRPAPEDLPGAEHPPVKTKLRVRELDDVDHDVQAMSVQVT